MSVWAFLFLFFDDVCACEHRVSAQQVSGNKSPFVSFCRTNHSSPPGPRETQRTCLHLIFGSLNLGASSSNMLLAGKGTGLHLHETRCEVQFI